MNKKGLQGPELLLIVTHALKGRPATCLTKLDITQLEWPHSKEILLAKFSRPMLPQDYFYNIMRFQINAKETAAEAATRLWGLI